MPAVRITVRDVLDGTINLDQLAQANRGWLGMEQPSIVGEDLPAHAWGCDDPSERAA